MLVGERRHRGPVIVDVGHAVCAKHVQIAWPQQRGVADFRGVLRACRELSEKVIEPVEKCRWVRTPALKFKYEGTEFLPQTFLRQRQDHILERACIEKSRIGLSRLGAIARKAGIHRDGDLFPHFGAEPEVIGNLFRVVGQVLCAGRSVERMVDADGVKERRAVDCVGCVFRQRVLAESIFGVGPVIDNPLPAFIGP